MADTRKLLAAALLPAAPAATANEPSLLPESSELQIEPCELLKLPLRLLSLSGISKLELLAPPSASEAMTEASDTASDFTSLRSEGRITLISTGSRSEPRSAASIFKEDGGLERRPSSKKLQAASISRAFLLRLLYYLGLEPP
jgi:hypothetical protein